MSPMSCVMLRLLAPLALIVAARGQAQVEWDHDLSVAAPERLVIRRACPDAHGGWYIIGSRADPFSNPKGNHWWELETPVLWHFDAQGVMTNRQDLAPFGVDHSLPDVAVDSNGGVVVTAVPNAASILRLDANGAQMWTAPIPAAIEQLAKIGFTPNGDVIAGGSRTNGAHNVSATGWSAGGSSTFLQTNPIPNPTGANCAISADGTVAVASGTNLFSPGLVVVYHADGSLAWSATTPIGTEISALAFTPAGGLVSAGDFYNPTGTAQHAQVLAWDASGGPTWSWTESGYNLSRLNAVSVANDGFIAVAGDGLSNLPGAQQALLVLLDAGGALRWKRLWSAAPGQEGDVFQQVLFRAAGDVVAGGRTFLNHSPVDSLLRAAPSVACFRREGVLAWQYVGLSLHNDEECRSLQETLAGSIVFASAATHYPSNNSSDPDGARFLSIRPQENGFCFGDGTGTLCPCGNSSVQGAGSGCSNSVGLAAHLGTTGDPSLSDDTIVLTSLGELTSALSIVLQGDTSIAPVAFGDGLRCAGGSLKRLYVKHATGGVVSAPEMSDPSISSRSAALGDTIPAGALRYYQVYYRDPDVAFCPAGFNSTNAVAVLWAQ